MLRCLLSLAHTIHDKRKPKNADSQARVGLFRRSLLSCSIYLSLGRFTKQGGEGDDAIRAIRPDAPFAPLLVVSGRNPDWQLVVLTALVVLKRNRNRRHFFGPFVRPSAPLLRFFQGRVRFCLYHEISTTSKPAP